MLETSVRLLRLLSLLQARPDWSGAELAERLGVTTRTVRNDIRRLRSLGYQVQSAPGTTGGYRLGAGAALPPLLLDDEEAIAVAVGLHAAAGGTVTGIEEASLRADQAAPAAALPATPPYRRRPRRHRHRGQPRADRRRRDPDRDRRRHPRPRGAPLRLPRPRRHRQPPQRRTAPVGLHRASLVLGGLGRRPRRLADLPGRPHPPRVPNGPRFTPRPPPGGDAVAHVVRGAGSTAWPHPATVRLHAPAKTLAEPLPPAAGLLRPDSKHTSILETGSDSPYGLVAFRSSLEVAFTFIEPPELRELPAALAARYQAAARDPSA
jgi:biotin operon repressor